MKGKITFNKSGRGSKTARLNIPVVFVELMKITEDEREVEITFKDGKLVIEKAVITMLKNVSYKDMEKFILDNMESTYNVKDVLSAEVNDIDNECMGVFEMYNSKFEITVHVEVKNEDTEDEEVICTYDVEKIK